MNFGIVREPQRNRFSQINPGKMGRRFWQAHMSDGDPEKFTLDEAKVKLKEQKYAVMLQEAFDRIINDKYSEAFEKAKKEYSGGDADALKKEVEKLNSQIAELKKDKPDMIPKAEHEALLKAKEGELSKRDEMISGLKNTQKENELLKAIGPKAVDPEAVLALSRDKFALGEDGKLYHVNEKGEKVVDGEGYVSVDRFYDGFFKEKPYLAKASDSRGANSSTQNGGGNQNGQQSQRPEGYVIRSNGGS